MDRFWINTRSDKKLHIQIEALPKNLADPTIELEKVQEEWNPKSVKLYCGIEVNDKMGEDRKSIYNLFPKSFIFSFTAEELSKNSKHGIFLLSKARLKKDKAKVKSNSADVQYDEIISAGLQLDLKLLYNHKINCFYGPEDSSSSVDGDYLDMIDSMKPKYNYGGIFDFLHYKTGKRIFRY
jgi:hypothetical protein